MRQETLSAEGAMQRLQGIGAEFMRQGNGKQLYKVPSYGLYAVVQRRWRGVQISYFKDPSECGC